MYPASLLREQGGGVCMQGGCIRPPKVSTVNSAASCWLEMHWRSAAVLTADVDHDACHINRQWSSSHWQHIQLSDSLNNPQNSALKMFLKMGRTSPDWGDKTQNIVLYLFTWPSFTVGLHTSIHGGSQYYVSSLFLLPVNSPLSNLEACFFLQRSKKHNEIIPSNSDIML